MSAKDKGGGSGRPSKLTGRFTLIFLGCWRFFSEWLSSLTVCHFSILVLNLTQECIETEFRFEAMTDGTGPFRHATSTRIPSVWANARPITFSLTNNLFLLTFLVKAFTAIQSVYIWGVLQPHGPCQCATQTTRSLLSWATLLFVNKVN
jgi:hypothetical protein